jgi:hypothetical protein
MSRSHRLSSLTFHPHVSCHAWTEERTCSFFLTWHVTHDTDTDTFFVTPALSPAFHPSISFNTKDSCQSIVAHNRAYSRESALCLISSQNTLYSSQWSITSPLNHCHIYRLISVTRDSNAIKTFKPNVMKICRLILTLIFKYANRIKILFKIAGSQLNLSQMVGYLRQLTDVRGLSETRTTSAIRLLSVDLKRPTRSQIQNQII